MRRNIGDRRAGRKSAMGGLMLGCVPAYGFLHVARLFILLVRGWIAGSSLATTLNLRLRNRGIYLSSRTHAAVDIGRGGRALHVGGGEPAQGHVGAASVTPDRVGQGRGQQRSLRGRKGTG